MDDVAWNEGIEHAIDELDEVRDKAENKCCYEVLEELRTRLMAKRIYIKREKRG